MNSQLTKQDLHFVVRRIPADVRTLMMNAPLFLGGGFIRETISGAVPKDMDLFGPTQGTLVDIANALAAQRKVRVRQTDNAITVLCPPRLPVQFITRWLYSEAAPLLESFDFTVCQAVIWLDKTETPGKWASAITAGFYPDLAARRLAYTSPVREEAAGGSMMRVLKFLARGYNIQAPSLGAVVARLVSKVRDISDLDEEMRGKVITGLLREVDPLLVVDGLELIDEHDPI